MPPLFQRGSRFSSSAGDDGRWQVVRKLGEGQFAEVYEVRDTNARDKDARYAVKIDKRRDIKSVKQELKVLQRLAESAPQSVCQCVVTGTWEERSFIVMELLGPNLAEARLRGGGCVAPSVVRCVGLSTLSALQGMHQAGYVHRDVKPANFALFPPDSNMMQGTWKIIDFGLARRYTSEETGAVLPQRPDAAFRGSTTYASVHAHAEQDLGRRDDLWSWLYCLVELLDGTLPWRADAAAAGAANAREGEAGAGTSGREARDRVHQLKQQCMSQPTLLCRNMQLPEPLLHISNHLLSLGFADSPDYTLLRTLLLQLGDTLQQHLQQPQHQQAWQQQGQGAAAKSHAQPMMVDAGPSHEQHLAWQQQLQQQQGATPATWDTPASPPQAMDGGRSDPASHPPGPPPPPPLPQHAQHHAQHLQHPQQLADERAVRTLTEAAAAVQMGLLSPEAHQLHLRLKSLHPVEALAVVAATLQDAVEGSDASAGTLLAQALNDLSVFTRAKAEQAHARYMQHCPQQQQQQQQQKTQGPHAAQQAAEAVPPPPPPVAGSG